MALRSIARRLLPDLSRVVVTTPSASRCLATEFAVSPDRIHLVPPGTTDAPRSPGTSGCVILSVGAVVPRKGHDRLLRALAQLPDLVWSLVIVGDVDGDLVCVAALRHLAEELGIAARIRFVGDADEGTLDALWREADLFASASRWEGTGTTVLEALRRGVPPVVTTELAAFMPAEAGTVCSGKDPGTMSKVLRRLIFDRVLRQELSDAAWHAGRALPGWAQQASRFVDALT